MIRGINSLFEPLQYNLAEVGQQLLQMSNIAATKSQKTA